MLGRPLPKVQWWYENKVINNTSVVLSDKRVKNTLVLHRLERKHLKSVFTCQAANNNVTNPISASVTLDMNCKYRQTHTLSKTLNITSHIRRYISINHLASYGE
ncbi:AGAP002104-PA-like protein [Anopheles sinensis]|uniref:AGAP002104-PA-like protein n=1 Tax=Anopheles sinensis TaxID=74873 RepID=A0A084VBF4_ANOSI|nr:AGAP002104-PA-like protein [Anopheles sinensis]